jgi:formiminotetrahydrofolate cyclodeaminase
MEIAALAGAVLALLDELKDRVSPYLLSDLKVAAVVSLATAQSAALNVQVNLRELSNPAEVEQLDRLTTQLLETALNHRNSVLNQRA